MKIDVVIHIISNNISVISKVADYSETRPCNIALSKPIGTNYEAVEGVGEDWTLEILVAEGFECDKGTRTYRIVNPFVPQNFEPLAASQMIQFFCRKSFYLVKPPRGNWRMLLGLDFYELELRIENYLLVPIEKKSEFEKLLSKITRKYRIE